jgi:hypothetical protein
VNLDNTHIPTLWDGLKKMGPTADWTEVDRGVSYTLGMGKTINPVKTEPTTDILELTGEGKG